MKEMLRESMIEAYVTTESLRRKYKKVFAVVLTVSIILSMALMVLAAPEDTIEAGIREGSSRIYSILCTVMLPVAGVILAWNIFKALVYGEKGMEQAKKTIFMLVIVMAGVWLTPYIVYTVNSWFSESGDPGVFTTQ